MEEEIEIRDNLNYDTLDKTPGWLMKWGVTAVILTMLTLLCLAAVIPYNQVIQFPVTVGNQVPFYVLATDSGQVTLNRLAETATVHKGDTLITISTPEQQPHYIIAPCTGFTVYPDNSILQATHISSGDTLVKIFPAIEPEQKIIATGYYPGPIPEMKPAPAGTVIKVNDASGRPLSIKSRLLYTSLIPVEGDSRLVILEPDSTSINNLSAQTPLYHGLKGSAVITVKKRSLIQWIFE